MLVENISWLELFHNGALFSGIFFIFGGISLYSLRLADFFSEPDVAAVQAQRQFLLIQLIFFFGLGLALFRFSTGEVFVPYWDFAGYWKGSVYFAKLWSEDVQKALRYLFETIDNDEYNALPCLLLTPWLNVFGTTYANYIFSIYIGYAGPLLVLWNLLIYRMLHISEAYRPVLQNIWVQVAITASTFLLPAFSIPITNGYLDALGLFFIVPMLVVTFNKRLLTGFEPVQSLVYALCAVLLILTRRWYLVFVAGLAVANIAMLVAELKQNKAQLRYRLKYFMLNFGLVAMVFLVVTYAISPSFFQRTFSVSYADVYAAYRFGDYWFNIKLAVKHYGLFYAMVACLGAWMMIDKNTTSSFGIFIIALTVAAFSIFLRINSPGQHHYYLIFLPITLAAAFGVVTLSYRRHYVARLWALLSLVNMGVVFYGSAFDVAPLKWLFSHFKSERKMRSDMEQLRALVLYLSDLPQDPKSGIYCLASSHVLNDDILRNFSLVSPGNPHIRSLLDGKDHAHVDRRDAFPLRFLSAGYVCVAEPIQFHLDSTDQHVVGYLAGKILYDSAWHSKYELLKTFELDEGVKAKVFKRTGFLSLKQLVEIEQFFSNQYPQFSHKYHLLDYGSDTLKIKFIDVQEGDNYGTVEYYPGVQLFSLHPGLERPSSFTFINQGYKTLTFSAKMAEAESLKKQAMPQNGEVYISIYGDGKLLEKKYVNWQSEEHFRVEVAPYSQIKVEVDKGRYLDYVDRVDLKYLSLIY